MTLLTLTQCAPKNQPAAKLSESILGIKPGMSRDDAERHLREIGKLSRDEAKNQQVWMLNENPNFGSVAVGYDQVQQVRYITAIAKPKDGQPIFYKDVGDLTVAKSEIAGPNHRYTWEVPANEGNPDYSVILQGTNAESLSLYTISKRKAAEREEDEDEEERDK